MTQDQQRALAAKRSKEAQAEAKRVNALLPCPFCGGTRALVHKPTCTKLTPYNPADRAFPTVHCGCGASVWGEDWDQSCTTAVTAWNRRAAIAKATGTPPPSDTGAETP